MKALDFFFFVIYPYIAVSVCVLGCVFRYQREQYTWQAGSSQMLRNDRFSRIALNLFHIGIILSLGGHLVGLLTPHWVYEPIMTIAQKQMIAMIGGIGSGTMILIGALMLVYRRWNDKRVSSTSSAADKMILMILLIQVILGMLSIRTSAQHLDGEKLAGIAEWCQSLFTFDAFNLYTKIADVSIIYQLHVILGFTILLLVPFTRLVHAVTIPLGYFGRKNQIVRSRGPVVSTDME